MKVRVGLVLAVATGLVWLSGCQSSASKAEEPTVETKPVVTSAEKADAKEPTDAEKPKTRTVRTRDPKTGKNLTKEVPVTTTTADSSSTKTRTVRTRDAKTGRIITKQVPVTTTTQEKPEGAFEITWSEKCSVQQAFNATNQLLYETLGLKKVVPSGRKYIQEPASDYMSARLKACSTIGIQFDVSIFLVSPDMTSISVKAASSTQPDHILEKHTLFIRSKISEAIAHEPKDAVLEPSSFPKTMILDRSVDQVYTDIRSWVKEAGLSEISRYPGGDRYYKYIHCRCASGIEFYFSVRMIDSDKSKLEISVEKYEDKDEFNVILKDLEAALAELEKPVEAVEEAAVDTAVQG